MKFSIRYLTIFIFAGILACSNRSKSNEAGINQLLPPDAVADTPRDYNKDALRGDGQFNFNMLLATDLSVDLKLYDGSSVPNQQLSAALVSGSVQEGAEVNATVVLKNAVSKKILFAGRTDVHGHLETRLQLPAHVKDAILTIVKSKYNERNVVIENITQFGKIERGMGMLKSQDSLLNNSLLDTDGDLVPDVYDAFPADVARAFRYSVPADDFLSVAFEDNFPQLGDGDYNDFIARYRIERISNAANAIIEVSGDANAVAKLAGYDHRFGLFINFSGNHGTLQITNKNHLGAITGTQSTAVTDKANVVLFERTQQAFTDGKGHGAYFRIVFSEPALAETVDAAPFDPYLYVHNTGFDVHLLGKPSLPNTHNPAGSDGFRDANGFPRGLLVPASWYYPKEGKFIDVAYPKFLTWRQSLGQQNSDWFLFPVETQTVAAVNEYADRPAVILPSGFNPAFLQLTTEGVTLPDKLGGSYVPAGKVYNITMTNGQNNFGNDFARIEYSYNKTALQSAGLLEEFQVFYLDSVDKKWKPANKVTVDTATQKVTAYTNHFTPFVLTAAPTGGGNVPSAPACINADFLSGIGGSGSAKFSLVDENFKYLQDRPLYFIQPVNLPSPENAATFADLGFAGAMGISTCNGGQTPCSAEANHKHFTDIDYINFTAHTNIDVYVMYDTRGGTGRNDVSQDAPWLTAKGFTVDIKGNGGTAPDYFVQTTDGVVYYTVYKKTYAQGQVVSLDGNRRGVTDPAINTNYWVIIKPAGNTAPNSASSLCVAAPDTNPPAKVTNLQAIPGATNVTLLWQNPVDPDFAGVVIRRSTLAPPADINEGVEANPRTVFSPESFRDDSVVAATTYFYSVFALDANTNRQLGASIMVVTGADSDGDGLTNTYENTVIYPTTLKSNPAIADTDGDGTSDGVEVANGTDPTNGDATKPNVTAFTATSPPTTSNALVTFNLVATDNVAVTGYMITLNNTPPLASNSNWSAVTGSYAISGGLGSYTLYAWAKDAAGNVSNVTTTMNITIKAPLTWVAGPAMPGSLFNHTATLLGNGKVLIAGGTWLEGTPGTSAAWLYDPLASTLSPAPNMSSVRSNHTVTLLPNGKVLLLGGLDANLKCHFSTELYSPATNTFTPGANVDTPIAEHTATLLNNGKVLIAGGRNDSTGLFTARLYDPVTDSFSAPKNMLQFRRFHTATLLSSGKVLIAGGGNFQGQATAELYDPVTDTFGQEIPLATSRVNHSANLLPDGRVLLAGGDGIGVVKSSAEIYDPATQTSTPTVSMLTPRVSHASVLLNNGKILFVGGRNHISGYLSSAELFDAITNTFATTANMTVLRYDHTATLLSNGQVFVVGGSINIFFTELFD